MPAATTTRPISLGSFTLDAVEATAHGRDEPAWLVERRRNAFEVLERSPWPTLRDEEWRRTDIRAFKLANFQPPGLREVSTTGALELQQLQHALDGVYAAGAVQCDGSLVRPPVTGALDPRVVFVDLSTAHKTHPQLLEKHLLTQAVDPAGDVLSALHAAFWTTGVLLYVPRGVKLDTPLYQLIGLSSQGQSDFSHTLIVLEDGAEATFVQETASAPGRNAPGLHVGAVEIILGSGANLRFVNIQNWDQQVWHFSRERAIVGRDASLQWTVGGLGARLAKVNQEVALTGQGARAQVNGVMFTTGRQNLTYLTRQDHAAPHATSDLLYKAVLKDSSRVVWKGMIRVEKDAQRTDAYQKNDNLVLADTARADSIPGLEIEANDVRCTHGATVGRVDEDMIFYLGARGIPRPLATRLIVEGFFSGVFDRISVEPVRDTLRAAVAAKLGLGSATSLVDHETED